MRARLFVMITTGLMTGCTAVTNLDELTRKGADGGEPSKCTHTFCDDFDTGMFGDRWSMSAQNAGPIGLDPTMSVSPPRSLLATATSTTSGASALYKNFDIRSSIKTSMSLFIERGTTTHSMYEVDPLRVVYMVPPMGFRSYSVHIAIYGSGAVIEEGGRTVSDVPTYTTTSVPAQITFGAPWTVYRFEVDAKASKAKLFAGGAEVAAHVIGRPPTGTVQIVVGAAFVATVSGWRIHIDDVAVDVD